MDELRRQTPRTTRGPAVETGQRIRDRFHATRRDPLHLRRLRALRHVPERTNTQPVYLLPVLDAMNLADTPNKSQMVESPHMSRFIKPVMRLVLLLLFVGILVTPVLAMILGFGQTSPADFARQEKRNAATFPAWKWDVDSIKAYPEKFEDWFADHFGFRRFMISRANFIRFELGASAKPENVYIGKDNWLFMGQYSSRPVDVRSIHLGLDTFSQETLGNWIQSVDSRRTWLQRRGIPFVVVIVPSKVEIYDEFAPKHLLRDTPRDTRTDQVIAVLHERNIPVISLRELLRNSKEVGQLYFKGDTHWNSLGAYTAYKGLTTSLRSRLQQPEKMKNAEVKEFSWREATGAEEDLAAFLGIEDFYTDFGPAPIFAETHPIYVSGIEEQPTANERLIMNHERVRIAENPSLADAPNALLLRDSFTNFLFPYFNRTFHRAVYAQHGAYQRGEQELGIQLSWLVDEYDPQVVMLVILEDFLSLPFPDHPNFNEPRLSSKEIAATFDLLSPGTSFLDPTEFAKGLTPQSGIQTISALPDGVGIVANNTHPVLLLPHTPFQDAASCVVKLDISSPAFTNLSVLYANSATKKYVADQLVSVPIRKGRQIVYLDMGAENLYGRLRLDPGHVAGEYILHGMEVRHITQEQRNRALQAPK